MILRFFILFFISFFIFQKKIFFLDFRFLTNKLEIKINQAYFNEKIDGKQWGKKIRNTFEGENQGKNKIEKKNEKAKILRNEKLEFINTRLVSGDSFLKNQEVKDVFVRFPFLDSLSLKHKVNKIKIHPSSNFMVEVSSPNHQPSLFSTSGSLAKNQKTVNVFSKKYIQNLLNVVAPDLGKTENLKEALIVGKVVDSSGKPLHEAQVEIDTEGVFPIYFSGFIPDLNRKETSPNGSFAFLIKNIKENEARSLRFLHNGVYSVAKNVSLKIGYISNAVLTRELEKGFKFHPYDAFDGSFPSPFVDIKIFGHSEIITLKANEEERSFHFHPGDTPIQVYMDPGSPYLLAHYSFHLKSPYKNEENLFLPAFHEEWLVHLIEQGKKPYDPEKAIILILCEEMNKNCDFELINSKLLSFPSVYFDREGESISPPLSSSSENKKSANIKNSNNKALKTGMMLYNVDIGSLREVSVLLKNKSLENQGRRETIVYNRLHAPDPDPGIINVILINNDIE